MTHDEVRNLLDKLCVELGFCLNPAQVQRLADDPPRGVEEFADEVFRSEGMDPETADRHLYRQVRDLVAVALQGEVP